jgi:hypothetical protein
VRISTKGSIGTMSPKPCPQCGEESLGWEGWSELLWREHWRKSNQQKQRNSIPKVLPFSENFGTVLTTTLCKTIGGLKSEARCMRCHLHPCVEA